MANVFEVQTLADGPRNAVFKVVGLLDTADLTDQLVVDVSTLSSMQPGMAGSFPPGEVSITKIEWDVEDSLEVRLEWDATTDKLIGIYTGRGEWKMTRGVALWNDAGAGSTGDILLSTQGWTASAVLSFTFHIHCLKKS